MIDFCDSLYMSLFDSLLELVWSIGFSLNWLSVSTDFELRRNLNSVLIDFIDDPISGLLPVSWSSTSTVNRLRFLEVRRVRSLTSMDTCCLSLLGRDSFNASLISKNWRKNSVTLICFLKLDRACKMSLSSVCCRKQQTRSLFLQRFRMLILITFNGLIYSFMLDLFSS